MKRLCAAKRCRHGLEGRAHDIVVGILFLQGDAGRLAVGAQHERSRLLRIEFLHDTRPEQACGAKLGDLHEEIHADGEEERQAPCKFIDIEALVERCAHIFAPVGKRECQFLHQCRASLLHVIAGDGNGIELRHFLRRIGDDIRNNPHGRFRRIDIGIADHELLENVVLDRAGKLGARHALFFACDDETGEDWDNRAVHGHGNGDFLKRNAVEKDFHVLDGIDCHACFADITFHSRMVAVIAAVGGKVEGHRDALLTGCESLAVERIGFFGGRKTRILADGPWATSIHGCAGAAQKRFKTG